MTTLLAQVLPMFKKGIGTLAYRDSWNLFDQIIISKDIHIGVLQMEDILADTAITSLYMYC